MIDHPVRKHPVITRNIVRKNAATEDDSEAPRYIF